MGAAEKKADPIAEAIAHFESQLAEPAVVDRIKEAAEDGPEVRSSFALASSAAAPGLKRIAAFGRLAEWGFLTLPEAEPEKPPPSHPYPNGMPPDRPLRFVPGGQAPAPPSDWEEPTFGQRPAAVPFPLDVLPGPLAELAAEAAEALPCPADFVAAQALVAAGGAIGRALVLRVKESWFETASLYLTVCAEPGATKSEAQRIATEPISRRHGRDLFDYAVERELAKEAKRARDAERRTKGLGVEDDAAPPPLRRVRVGDTTTEKLAVVLSQNPRGVVMIQDELTAWISGMNQYKGGAGADRQFYLSVWSGAPISIDRKSQADGVPIHVPHPFLSVVGNATPDLLPDLNPGGKEDGFLDRILFSYPDPVRVRFSTRSVSQRLRDEWSDAVNRLYSLPLGEDGYGAPKPAVVGFTRGALERFAAWFDAHCEETEADDFPRNLKGPWAKLRGYCARIALTLAAVHWAYEPESGEMKAVDTATLNRAIRLVDYFKAHVARAHHSIFGARSDNEDARDILAWALRRGKPTFTMAEAKDNFRRRFAARPAILDEALGWLVTTHSARRQPRPDKPLTGRAGSPVYELNPKLIESARQMRQTPGGKS